MPKPGNLLEGFAPVLTDKELRFIEEYCVDLEPGAAAIRAGLCSADDSTYRAAIGARLMKRPEVQQAIDERLRSLSMRTVSNATYVRERLTEVVERCMQKEQVMERRFNPETKRTEEMPTGEWAFNAQGANKALELLGRHHGMFADKVTITIEHELKALTEEQLNLRIARIMEEQKALDLIQMPDGVYAPASVQRDPVLIEQRPEPEPEPGDGDDAIPFVNPH